MPHKFRSTKTYGHDVGLSACFRQWRAASHCRLLHGYALAVHLEFEAETLDENNWVVDFGGLKGIKAWLVEQFDHVLLVAEDDPKREYLLALQDVGLAKVNIVPNTGCEAFATQIFQAVQNWVSVNYGGRVRLHKVEVREHGANSAMVVATQPTGVIEVQPD